jgi:hypothetical protein
MGEEATEGVGSDMQSFGFAVESRPFFRCYYGWRKRRQ